MTTDEKVGVGISWLLNGLSGGLAVIFPPVGIPLAASSLVLTAGVAHDIGNQQQKRRNNITRDTSTYYPNPKAINYPAANLYTDDVKNNLQLTLGKQHKLTLAIKNINRHNLNPPRNHNQIKQTYKNTINQRITFLKTYLKKIENETNLFTHQQNNYTNHPRSDQQDDDGEDDSDDENQHLQQDLLQQQGTLQLFNHLLNHLQNLHNNIHIEQISLTLEKNQLDKNLPSLLIYTCPNLHLHAYNRKQLHNAQRNLQHQSQNLEQKAQAFQTDIQTVQNQTQHLVIEKTPSILKLLELNSNILQSNLSTSIIEINTIQLRSNQIQEIIAYRSTLAQFLGMATRLLTSQIIMIVIGTATGPIGLAITAGAITLAGKAVEDLALNGGDFEGWQDDLCSKETASQVGKSILSSLLQSGAKGLIKCIPLGSQQKLDNDTLEKLKKLNQKLPEKPLLEQLTEEVTTNDSGGMFIGKTLMNITQTFGDNVINILAGEGVDWAINNAYPKKNNTNPNTIPSHDPNNPHFTATHQNQTISNELLYAFQEACLSGITQSITNLLGDKYFKHKQNNSTDNKPLGRPTLLGYFGHKATHGIIGCLYGAGQYYIQGRTTPQELIQAAKSGALGAIAGEIISEAYLTHIILPSLENILKNPTKLNPEEFQKHYQQQIKNAALAGKIAAIGNAYILGQDLEIASRAANNAIENNFLDTAGSLLVLAFKGCMLGLMLYDYYKICEKAEEIRLKEGWGKSSEYFIKELTKYAALFLLFNKAPKILGKIGKIKKVRQFLTKMLQYLETRGGKMSPLTQKIAQGLRRIRGAGVSTHKQRLNNILQKFPKLDKKYGKHVLKRKEWGNLITKEEYAHRVKDLFHKPIGNNILGFTSKKGTLFKYNKLTNEFMTITPNGIIQTFYKPKEGLKYYLKQVTKYS